MQNALYLAFGLFFLKHFIVDFLLQPSWMFLNKSKFGHPGGLAHSGLHSLVTGLLLYGLYQYGYVGPTTAVNMVVWLAVIEFPIHYMIDWAKMNASIMFGWGANTHMEFWYALGFDQLLHYLTYLYILMMWFR
jgi:hypothetical protein